jgi:hypothetical protein
MHVLTTIPLWNAAAPLWLSALLIVGVITAAGMAGPVVARWAFEIDRLDMNNEVAGFKFATVG